MNSQLMIINLFDLTEIDMEEALLCTFILVLLTVSSVQVIVTWNVLLYLLSCKLCCTDLQAVILMFWMVYMMSYVILMYHCFLTSFL